MLGQQRNALQIETQKNKAFEDVVGHFLSGHRGPAGVRTEKKLHYFSRLTNISVSVISRAAPGL